MDLAHTCILCRIIETGVEMEHNHTETFLYMRNGIFRVSYLEAEPCPEPDYAHLGDVLDTQIPEC